jgi:hypothetical protein
MAMRERYDVGRMPPPWRRSLTESGMTRRVTLVDRVVVAVLLVLLAALGAWIAGGGIL